MARPCWSAFFVSSFAHSVAHYRAAPSREMSFHNRNKNNRKKRLTDRRERKDNAKPDAWEQDTTGKVSGQKWTLEDVEVGYTREYVTLALPDM